jgi:Methylamine utilisation protein MauE
MSSFLTAALSGAFLLSAVMKFWQPRPFVAFVNSITTNSRLRRIVVLGIPALELAVGASLLTPFAPVAAIAAAAIAFAFVAVGARALLMSDVPGCGCFGQLDAATPHAVSLVRSVILTGGAVACSAVVLGTNIPRPVFLTTTGLLAGFGVMTSMTLLGQIIAFRKTLIELLTSQAEGAAGA